VVESRLISWRGVLALVVSSAVHVALGAAISRALTQPNDVEPPDVWSGVTAASANTEVFEVTEPTESTESRIAAPTPTAVATAAPNTAPNAERTAAPASAALDVSTRSDPVTTPRPTLSRADAPAARHTRSASSSVAVSSAPSAASVGGGAASFGTTADAAKRDLGRAFTRALKDAGHGDRTWAELPTGHSATLELDLNIDAEGKISGVEMKTSSPLTQLSEIVRRTVAMLKFGVFSIREGEVSAGKQRIQLTSTTSDVDPASIAGGTTAMSFEYTNGHGVARFTQPSGRRVEVSVRLVRTTK
jgi:hypothetical protein